MNIIAIWRLCLAGCFALLSASVVYAEYTVTDLGLYNSTALDINNSGEIVGETDSKAFIWKGGLLSDSTFLDNKYSSEGVAINASGQSLVNNRYDIYLVDKTISGSPVTKYDKGFNVGRDVNNDEFIIGSYVVNLGSGNWQPYLWRNTRESLGSLGGDQGAATAVNNADPFQVVGTSQNTAGNFQAFLWTDGNGDEPRMRPLSGMDVPTSVATAINDHGKTIGWFSNSTNIDFSSLLWRNLMFPSSDIRAFVWIEKDHWRDLGTLATDDAGRSAATNINNLDQVVGYSDTDFGEEHAFLYTIADDLMVDLNTFLHANSGWVLNRAYAINDKGQIVGWGLLNGQKRAFLLSPKSLVDPIDLSLDIATQPVAPLVDEAFIVAIPMVLRNDSAKNLSVNLQITLPPELEIELNSACIQNDQVLICDIGEFSQGLVHEFELRLIMKGGERGRFPLAVTATVSGPNGIEHVANQTITTVITRHEPEISRSFDIKNLGTTVSTDDDRGPRINLWGDVALGGNTGRYYSGGVVRVVSDGKAGNVLSGINDGGTFVGYKGNGDNRAHIFKDDEWSVFDNMPNDKTSEAMAINNFNQAVGFISHDDGFQAYLKHPDQEPDLLGYLDSSYGISIARDVNDLGMVVGNSQISDSNSHAFLYNKDDPQNFMKDLGTLGGAESFAYAINNNGIIVGATHDSTQQLRAASYENEKGWIAFESLEGETKSRAFDMNSYGVAVGSAELDKTKSAVRYVDNKVEDLNAYLPKNSTWRLSSASGVNDVGEIVGVATSNGNNKFGFLMTELTKRPLYAEKSGIDSSESEFPEGVGNTMEIDNDILVIGAPNDSENGVDAGAVFIYQRDSDNNGWKFRAKLKGESNSHFGKAISLEGKHLAVASRNYIYFYRGGGVIWQNASDPISISSAIDFDLNGDVLAVVSRNTLNMYTFNDGVWRQIGQSLNSTRYYSFNSVVVDKGHVFASQYGSYSSGPSRVNYYRFHDDGLSFQKWIVSGSRKIFYGSSLALEDDYLFVGASGLNNDRGIVKIFRMREDGEWVPYDTLFSSGKEDTRDSQYSSIGERFGASLDIDGDFIAVGAPNGNEGEHAAGGVYIFQRHGNRWIEEIKLTTDEPKVNQQLGASVALDGMQVVSGAPNRPDKNVFSYTLKHSSADVDLALSVDTSREIIGKTQELVYTIIITNLSDTDDATGLRLTQSLSDKFEYSSSSPECALQLNEIVCQINHLPAGAEQKISVTATAIAEGLADSQFQISANQNDPDRTNNEFDHEINVEVEPPPEIIFGTLGDDDGVISLRPFDELKLAFDVENWEFSEEGTHAHWSLNGVEQDELYTKSALNLSELEEGTYTLTLKLVDAEHKSVTSRSIAFEIKRPLWPSANILEPKTNGEFIVGSTVRILYELDIVGPAQSEKDFILYVNDNDPEELNHRRQMVLPNLEVGTYTVRIKYKDSKDYDAEVTFTIKDATSNDPDPKDPDSGGEQEDTNSDVGGASNEITGGSGALNSNMLALLFVWLVMGVWRRQIEAT